MKARFVPWGALTLLCIALMFVFVVYPLAGLILNSLKSSSGGFGLDGFEAFLGSTEHVAALANSLVLGLTVTITATLVGVPFACIVSRFEFPLKGFVAVLPIATIIIPDVVVCQAWILVFGNNGIVTSTLGSIGINLPSFYGWGGMIFVMTLGYYTYIYLGTLAALRGIDGQLEEASCSLGRTPTETFLRVVVPAIAPAILINATVVFALVVGNFSVAMILGRGVPLLSIMTYNAFVSELGGSPLMQSTLSVIMIVIIATALFVQKQVVERKVVQMTQGRAPQERPLGSWQSATFAGSTLFIVLLSLIPLVIVFAAAFTESRGPVIHWGNFSLSTLNRAFTFGVEPAINSIRFAGMATIVGVSFAVLVSYLTIKRRTRLSQALDYLVFLPLTISGTVLGIGMVQSFNGGWLVLTGTASIMVVTYVVRRLPASIRSASSGLYNIPDSIEEASISLGVSPIRTFFKVVLPVMSASIGAAACLTWAGSLAELSASIVVYSGGLETLPIAIFRQVDGNRMGQASAYGAILVTLILLPVLAAVRLLRLNLFSLR